MGSRDRRPRALLGPSQEQASGPVRVSALHSRLRHLQPRLPVDERRARIHAAAGLLLIAAYMPEGVAGPLRRREHPQGERRRVRMGRRRGGQRHARAGATGPRHHRARACGRQGRHAGRPLGLRLARNVSGHRLSPYRRDGRRHRSRSSRCSTRAWRGRPRRCASRPRSGCRCSSFRSPPTISSRSRAT